MSNDQTEGPHIVATELRKRALLARLSADTSGDFPCCASVPGVDHDATSQRVERPGD